MTKGITKKGRMSQKAADAVKGVRKLTTFYSTTARKRAKGHDGTSFTNSFTKTSTKTKKDASNLVASSKQISSDSNDSETVDMLVRAARSGSTTTDRTKLKSPPSGVTSALEVTPEGISTPEEILTIDSVDKENEPSLFMCSVDSVSRYSCSSNSIECK